MFTTMTTEQALRLTSAHTGQAYEMHERIKHALLSAGLDEAIIQEDGSAIGVFCKAEDSHGDKEWFNSVLAALNN